MRAKTKTFLLLFNAIVLLQAESTLEKAVEYRKAEQFSQAERLLKKYSVPADFSGLSSSEKPEFLRGVLELAHVRALQDDVPGALRLLNWAEGRSDPYHRAVSCVKYGEILIDLGEFERAEAYLKNADEIIVKRATEEESGAAIGQGGTTADSGAAWRDLRDDASVLKAEIESERLKKKFGASYANYVKLRRLEVLLKRSRTPRYMKEAMLLADELMKVDPASQFAAAAGYLRGAIPASRLKEESSKKEIKEVKDYLKKFVRQNPDGLYRGEALMLLGKISLEIEWNAKDAEKYYGQALNWFRKARERRDALSLYAGMTDDLKKQVLPTQKPTTLNQWKRIVYHDEDPLKLYNTANAPVWYVDDKEKECVYPLGFLSFANGNYNKAWLYWSEIIKLDSDQRKMDAVNFPNLIMRLREVCKQKEFIFSESQRKAFSNKNKLRLLYAELLYYEEKFHSAGNIFKQIAYDSTGNDSDRAAAYIGLTAYSLMSWTAGNTIQERIVTFKKYPEVALKISVKTPMHELALRYCALFLESSTDTNAMAIPYYKRLIKEYPKSRYAEEMLLRLGISYASQKNFDAATKILKQLKRADFVEVLSRTIKFMKGEIK